MDFATLTNVSMQVNTKFLLDSGDPDEYRELKTVAAQQGSELWGATTNPSLIAKKLGGQKYTMQEAFALQKMIVMDIVQVVPGAVSAEVYADDTTTVEQMVAQGKEIAAWHERVVVKLPTTLAGMKARTLLRKERISINNTLVFSQQQIFAICLHEHLVQQTFGPIEHPWPPFISPFVGRLDDVGEDGMSLVENGMRLKTHFDRNLSIWMLSSSIRTIQHVKRTIACGSDIMTAPAKVYREWFSQTAEQKEEMDVTTYAQTLKPIPFWEPPQELLSINTLEAFDNALTSGQLDIKHPLTDKGIARFTEDWKAILK